MIEMSYQETENGVFSLTVIGHALSAPPGEDLVCCAVSTLVYTAREAVTDLFLKEKLRKLPRISTQPGDAFLQWQAKKMHLRDSQAVLSVILSGFSMLAKAYPEHIKIMDASA